MNYHELIAKGFTGEPYSMFFHVWPWIGLGAAIVLLILIFCTDFLRSDKTKSRFLDPVSLAWMGSVIYMLHNLERLLYLGLHILMIFCARCGGCSRCSGPDTADVLFFACVVSDLQSDTA